jgi:ABC-type glycerol-3-phosphate transport system substrate-binding protein
MNNKKLNIIIGVLVLLSLMLASCQPAAVPTEPEVVREVVRETVIVQEEGETIVITATPELLVEEPVVITFAHMTWLSDGQEILDQAIAAFENDNPGITVEQTIIGWGEAFSQHITSLAAGVAPDIMMLGGTWPAEFYDLGALQAGDEYLPADFRDRFIPAALDSVVFDGQIYGIPWEGATWGFFYRTDLFEEAGLDPTRPPATWEELVEYGQLLTLDTTGDGNVDQWGVEMPAGGWEPDDYFLPIMRQAGNPVAVDTDAGWVSTIAEPSGIEALTFYYDLVNTYNIMPEDVIGKTWEDVKNDFVFGRTAMMYNGGWAVGVILDTAPEIEGNWATALPPAGPGGSAAHGYPNTLAVAAQSENPEIAWRFLEFLQTGDPSWADKYCLAHSSFNWTKAYAESEFAQQDLIAPLAEAMEISYNRPFATDYETFRTGYFNPGLQSLLRGDMTPEEAAVMFDEAFNRIHGTAE